MSDEASSTTAAAAPVAEHSASTSTEAAVGNDGSPRADWLRKRLLSPLRKKAEFVSDLMFKLDLVIYAELVVMYYLE
jgi:hypothetical protein